MEVRFGISGSMVTTVIIFDICQNNGLYLND